ncbi:fasciclin domain-containing protein [Microlunatus capsulatus]|uniref:Surface protein with fasciclin (FAS1) repeats n=1 Tax=Microlunatus capsulatus TaxID=99117 RepID=A0ABS4ZB76_9ACTN|nr:fasciclin domain-containing protein [Microlunatus capsulatus]MBP2418266.1 putative surface protein with fasciclin (FAS1) repeats [Microlunatus capsulatus]
MSTRRLARAGGVLAVALGTSVALALPAAAHGKPAHQPGDRSLATVLAKDGAGFDRDPRDFDILDNAVTAVLTADPASPVAVLADGDTALTAFLPTDQAFRRLAHDLTGTWYRSESRVFTVLAEELGVETIEAVLLYHVVPGATITYRQALRSDGAALTTATGATVQVDVVRRAFVRVVDADPDDADAVVVKKDVNRGNLQIGHAVSQVLRPVDL